jgi:hypothetical protein
MARIIIGVIVVTYFGAFGVVAIIWPEKVRAFYQKQASVSMDYLKKWPAVSRVNPTQARPILYRLFGVVSLSMSLLLVYNWLKG